MSVLEAPQVYPRRVYFQTSTTYQKGGKRNPSMLEYKGKRLLVLPCTHTHTHTRERERRRERESERERERE